MTFQLLIFYLTAGVDGPKLFNIYCLCYQQLLYIERIKSYHQGWSCKCLALSTGYLWFSYILLMLYLFFHEWFNSKVKQKTATSFSFSWMIILIFPFCSGSNLEPPYTCSTCPLLVRPRGKLLYQFCGNIF